MVAACGRSLNLQRLTMGLQLDPALALGEWRGLTADELERLTIFKAEL